MLNRNIHNPIRNPWLVRHANADNHRSLGQNHKFRLCNLIGFTRRGDNPQGHEWRGPKSCINIFNREHAEASVIGEGERLTCSPNCGNGEFPTNEIDGGWPWNDLDQMAVGSNPWAVFMKRFATLFLSMATLSPSAAGQDKKPRNKFTVGKETTYLTGPLDADGYVDYVEALNERLSKGVTPENNADALLWQAIGPRSDRKAVAPEFFRRLGIAVPAEQGDYFVEWYDYISKNLQIPYGSPEFAELNVLDIWAKQRTWTAIDHPKLASWLKVNEKPLAIAVQAAKRPRYYSPLVTKRGEILMGAVQPGLHKYRYLAGALEVRAMLKTSEGLSDLAWEDLMTCHRLARMVRQDGNMVSCLVGIAIDQIAFHAAVAFLDRSKLSSKQLENCLKDLQTLPMVFSLADMVDQRERLITLDMLMRIDRDNFKMLLDVVESSRVFPDSSDSKINEFKYNERKLQRLRNMSLDGIDLDPVLKNANGQSDRIVSVLREQDRNEREKKLAIIERERQQLALKLLGPGPVDPRIKGNSKARGEVLGEIVTCAFTYAAPQWMFRIFDRGQQTQNNLIVAFALARYERDHKHYPNDLDALAPNYLPRVPQDIFTGKPLIYRVKENGYLLYSVGPNGKDEEGRGPPDDPLSEGDDIAVRMPLPELRRR